MIVTPNDIESMLRTADIEDLLKIGAPRDEYAAEAKSIAAALARIPQNQLTIETITAIISLVWAKTFNLSSTDIEKRIPAFKAISAAILAQH